MRGTTSSSPADNDRRAALATMVSWLDTDRRTDTPDRWEMCGLWRASCEMVAMMSDMCSGTVTVTPSTTNGVASWRTISTSVSTSSG